MSSRLGYRIDGLRRVGRSIANTVASLLPYHCYKYTVFSLYYCIIICRTIIIALYKFYAFYFILFYVLLLVVTSC